MKIFTFLLFVLIFQNANSQTYKVMFDYDLAGNQYHKHIVFESGRNNSSNLDKEIQDVIDEEKEILAENIKYYPNPVKESLHVYWTNTSENTVDKINVVDMNGKILYESKVLNKTQVSIQLSNYAKGIYIMSLNYNNGESKSFKIIKN